jgi:DNA modification methylase
MAIKEQVIKDNYALYLGDCIEVMADIPDESIHLSVYSPPFRGLYHYSSSERDLSNCDSPDDFFEHYKYVVSDLKRITKKGRCTAVHCTDMPNGNTGRDALTDFPGDIIRMHESEGWDFICRHMIWKEPLTVRNRTMQKNLAHATLVKDSIYCGVASADQLLIFRRREQNEIPVNHPTGMDYYAGERRVPEELLSYRNYSGNQIENRYSHWIWRQYASCFWDDIRLDHVLPFKGGRDEDDEKHVHPLQLDVINRIIILRSNPGEVVFTPFMGVGSEVFCAVMNDRKGIGAELKESYYRQSIRNMEYIEQHKSESKEISLFEVENADKNTLAN